MLTPNKVDNTIVKKKYGQHNKSDLQRLCI